MAKTTYTSLKLKTNDEVKEIDFNGSKIEVRQYLPIADKIDLIDITLQNSVEGKLYNPLKVDMYFHLNMIYLYTNISFTDKQKEDEYKLYDTILSTGLLNAIIEGMNDDEYNNLYDILQNRMADILKYNTTAAAVISTLIEDLPKNAAAAKEIVDTFDKGKFQEVIDFASAANGNRPI